MVFKKKDKRVQQSVFYFYTNAEMLNTYTTIRHNKLSNDYWWQQSWVYNIHIQLMFYTTNNNHQLCVYIFWHPHTSNPWIQEYYSCESEISLCTLMLLYLTTVKRSVDYISYNNSISLVVSHYWWTGCSTVHDTMHNFCLRTLDCYFVCVCFDMMIV